MYKLQAYLFFQSKVNFIKNFIKSIYTRLIGSPFQPLNVYKVIRYALDSEDAKDVTDVFLSGCVIPYAVNEYLEFRVTWLHAKYRYIVSTDQPEYPCFIHFVSNDVKKRWIVKAVLMNPTENICEDVISRVSKFNGPNQDTFQKKILVNQMFKNDEMLPDMKLMVITMNGNLLSFDSSDSFDLSK